MAYRTTIDLNSDDQQLVLASQEMGTFYSIYATLTSTGINDEYNIKFELRNYRGPVMLKIDRIETVIDNDKLKYFKIHTGVGAQLSDYHIITLKIKKENYLICHRLSAKQAQLSQILVSEEEFTNELIAGETVYSLEQKLAEKFIEELLLEKDISKANKSLTAASKYFCIVGLSKVI